MHSFSVHICCDKIIIQVPKLDQRLADCEVGFTTASLLLTQVDGEGICNFTNILPDTSQLPVLNNAGGLFDYPGM